MRYEFKYVYGHVEVYLNGKFMFSADTVEEAQDVYKRQGQRGETNNLSLSNRKSQIHLF